MTVITENDHPKAHALRLSKPRWKARLLSVPHTGTRSVKELLVKAGWQYQKDFVQQHFHGDDHWIMDLPLPAIVPIRDKAEARASWSRRHRKDAAFEACWSHMEQFLADNPDTFRVHINDEAQREQDLQAIAEHFGLQILREFPHEGANGA